MRPSNASALFIRCANEANPTAAAVASNLYIRIEAFASAGVIAVGFVSDFVGFLRYKISNLFGKKDLAKSCGIKFKSEPRFACHRLALPA